MENKLNDLLNTRSTFFTASGIFTGLIIDIPKLESKGFAYVLEDVIFRPTGNIKIQMPLPGCVVYSNQIVASTLDIEPISFE